MKSQRIEFAMHTGKGSFVILFICVICTRHSESALTVHHLICLILILIFLLFSFSFQRFEPSFTLAFWSICLLVIKKKSAFNLKKHYVFINIYILETF